HHHRSRSRPRRRCLRLTRVKNFRSWSNLSCRLSRLFRSFFNQWPENFDSSRKCSTEVEDVRLGSKLPVEPSSRRRLRHF
ncbi:hypothetical protein TorRG33x02_200880, partial [Trema orientale]